MTTFATPTSFAFTSGAGALYTSGYYQALKDIRDAMLAAGFVQTSDTGQQDFTLLDTNATSPGALAANSLSPFFIMRMNDALQATKPFFIKIRCFSASGNTVMQGFHIQMGTGTNGTGGITGTIGNSTSGCYMPSATSTSGGISWSNRRTSFAAGYDGGAQFVMLFHEAGNTLGESAFFTIERTRDATGAYDGEGVLVQHGLTYQGSAISGSYGWHGVFPTNGATFSLSYGFSRELIFPRVMMDRSTLINGNDIGPMIPFGGGFFPKWRHSHVAFMFPWADFASYGTIFQMPVKGVTRTFRNMGWHHPYYQAWNHHGGTSSGADVELQRFGLAILWE